MVRLPRTNGIPPLVLEGRIPSFKSVNTVFLNETIKHWYRLAWRSYLARSEMPDEPNMNPKGEPKYGGQDEDGLRWKQLRPRTIKIKAGLQREDKYTEYISKIRTPAARVVQNLLEQMDYGAGEGINIRTGRTLAAFAVPRVVGNKLVAGPDQVIKINDNQVTMEVRHGYAEEVTEGRQYGRALFEDDVDMTWFKKAMEEGLKAARVEYDRLVQRQGPPAYLKRANGNLRSN